MLRTLILIIIILACIYVYMNKETLLMKMLMPDM